MHMILCDQHYQSPFSLVVLIDRSIPGGTWSTNQVVQLIQFIMLHSQWYALLREKKWTGQKRVTSVSH